MERRFSRQRCRVQFHFEICFETEIKVFNESILSGLRGLVKIPFIESLILAQDERWRHA